MKCIVIVLVIAAVVKAYPQDRYDGIGVEIFSNRRLLRPYIKCMLDQGRCSAEGKEIKSRIKEAMQTHCAKCSPIQLEQTKLVIKYLMNHERKYWNQLVAKYDPDRRFTRIYESELQE